LGDCDLMVGSGAAVVLFTVSIVVMTVLLTHLSTRYRMMIGMKMPLCEPGGAYGIGRGRQLACVELMAMNPMSAVSNSFIATGSCFVSGGTGGGPGFWAPRSWPCHTDGIEPSQPRTMPVKVPPYVPFERPA